ncbi:hydroxylamine reductase [Oscillospiraceae bacterium HV4-5-C5C]|nr:hydroxylamine reductase [Oscillospiraceae bacterium HV4-5-C5C]
METMFCFQCEQTAGGQACHGARGVCGKTQETALLQDEMTGDLIRLAADIVQAGKLSDLTMSTQRVMLAAMFAAITNVDFDSDDVRRHVAAILQERQILDINGVSKFTMASLWQADEDVRSLKSLILFGLRGMAAYASHALVLGYKDQEVLDFFWTALAMIANERAASDELLQEVLETGRVNLRCMALLDQANTETYGNPEPTKVDLCIEPGPFIVVSGHDLYDLYQLLLQTKDKGVNIYTHGEMLPCHAYPKLKAFPQLKGNFGTAWQNQQKEFDQLPAPVLFTTNCIMPVRDSYRDRIFTTGVVAYPGMVHIDESKDFTPVIEKALALGGYQERQERTGINGGSTVMTGFAHQAVESLAEPLLSAIKEGKIKDIFLVGGCDGAKPGRNYYTELVGSTPENSLVLTLACGKYRFNDLSLGEVAGFPRLMDMGQCNDAYSAIHVAGTLAEALNCSVNELPLHIVLSWYEQKAVCVLLSLLSLGIKGIYLGPTLPAFISPAVLKVLVENFDVHPIGQAARDLDALLQA